MSYLVINGEEQHYNVSKIVPFTTQHGYSALRFVGDSIPETDKGFKYFSDNDTLISDLSDYTHFYRDNQYSVEEDEIEYPAPNNMPSEPSALDRRLSSMSAQISAITPYTESKTAYIDDTECVFDLVKDGVISAYVKTGETQIPCTYEVVENKIIVSFEALEDVATVNISIQ